ncbi:MAG: ABC transporter substrate-binding protein [Candidatus Velthaea sp.]
MNFRRSAFVLLAALLLTTSIPAAVPAADTEIAIGSILPLTGASAQTSAGLKVAQQLAVDLVNGHVSYPLVAVGQNGIPSLGHAKIKLIFADSQGKPDQAKAAAEQLITQDHVVALLGTYISSTTATASQVAERYGIPFLTPTSANPGLHLRGFKWFFRTTPHDGIFAQNFFDFLADMKKQKKISVKKVAIVHEDGLFGTGSADAEEAVAKKLGYDVVTNIAYSATTSEVNAEVQKIKAAAPDIIMITSYLPDSLLFMKAFKEQNVQAQAILAQDAGFLDPGFVRTLGKDSNYVFTRDVFSLNIKNRNQGVPLINELFKARFNNTNLDGNTARDFMGVLVLADAINRAKSTKPDDIRVALMKTNIPGNRTLMPWKGIQFDEHGQNVKGAGIIEQMLDQKYETVWPFDVSVKPVTWPMPPWSNR